MISGAANQVQPHLKTLCSVVTESSIYRIAELMKFRSVYIVGLTSQQGRNLLLILLNLKLNKLDYLLGFKAHTTTPIS